VSRPLIYFQRRSIERTNKHFLVKHSKYLSLFKSWWTQ